jgi:cell division septum initiation protein DivIVA
MSLSELIALQSENENLKNNDELKIKEEALKKSELMLKEAALEADKIIFEANKKASNILEQKDILERKLKEFIEVEKELIKKYESEKH